MNPRCDLLLCVGSVDLVRVEPKLLAQPVCVMACDTYRLCIIDVMCLSCVRAPQMTMPQSGNKAALFNVLLDWQQARELCQ